MKVDIKEIEDVELGSLRAGETFSYRGTHYMRVGSGGKCCMGDEITATNLENGNLYRYGKAVKVRPTKLKIVKDD